MKFLFASLFLLMSITAKSQTPATDSVKAVVNSLFVAMKTSDAALLLSAFNDSAILQTIVTNKEGKMVVKNEPVKNFANAISKATSGSLDERIQFDMIKIDGALASVWTPYSFYYNNTFSHCGVNSFQLVRTSAGWKIQYLVDTRRKSGCLQ
jgi:hypothetical protein